MNAENGRERTTLVYLLAILGALLIVGLLVWTMVRLTKPAPIGANRAAERAKALAELRGAEAEALNSMAWLDQGKGFVRLRIEDAMKIVEREWQNPAAAKSNLVARVGKATEPPPKPPEAPSPFE